MNRSAAHTQLVGDLVADLNTVEGCYAWKNNTGSVKMPSGALVQFSEEGASDVIACFLGRLFALECKTGRGRLSPAQLRWKAKIESAGGVYAVVRQVADGRTALGVTSDHPRKLSRARVIPR